jgi:PhzF family phenazine biosynthesis protein
MKLPLYQVDAFTDKLFGGNPAAICPLDEWLPDATMQSIATENNLSETAFFVREGEGYALRWFTPEAEVDLCGHATLASAYLIFTVLEPGRSQVAFHTLKAGMLKVRRNGDLLAMELPSRPPTWMQAPSALITAIGAIPRETYLARDYMLVYSTAAEVAAIAPDMAALSALKRWVIVTGPGEDDVDFVSRFFAPSQNIPEDPVTGSAHCTLTPYWAARLGKTRLEARQISKRGGALTCTLSGDRVILEGRAVLYLEGTITV